MSWYPNYKTKMKKETDIAIIEHEVNTFQATATQIEITDEKSMTNAAAWLTKFNLKLDAIHEEKEKVVAPLNLALKAERGRWKPFETVLEEAIAMVRGKMGTYQGAMIAAAKAEEEKIAARTKEGKGNYSVDTAVRKMEEIVKPVAKVEAGAGSVSFREVKCFEIVDLKVLPIEYLLANEVAIRREMNAGREVFGVRYFTEMRPINSRG